MPEQLIYPNGIDAETGAPWPASDSTFQCWEVKVLITRELPLLQSTRLL